MSLDVVSIKINPARVSGTRYIQAPLCGPSERRRRPRSLTFDHLTPIGPMGASRQALPTPPGFDPVKADWLPVLIYQSAEYTARTSNQAATPVGWQVCAVIRSGPQV